MEEGEGVKKVFGVLAFFSFFYALGIVGGIEQDLIGLGEGFVRAIIAIGLMGLFIELSGASDPPDYSDTEERNRPQERHSRRR